MLYAFLIYACSALRDPWKQPTKFFDFYLEVLP